MKQPIPSEKSNRLALETSPYLLQHQHNPVDWYPWGPEAFEHARRENKPIFLSVGYSTCYWCHVMERQSFENEQIAEVMNRLFVCIKVDREERPDVDQLYMNAVQLIARQGGWPMSVFLTPQLEPFYGGTYYPPTDSYGRPGFPRICQAVHDAWVNRRSEVGDSCRQIVRILEQVSRPRGAESPLTIDAAEIGTLIDRSVADYEPHFGGFGNAPKFPRETLLEFLLTYLASDWNEQTTRSRTPRDKIRRMTLHTLDAMMHGGIRDHLGGGFHRYSTDAKWLVPHFEIMLYDNAMLLACYAEAHRQTGDPRYAQVARDCANFVLREMTSPAGAFYTALDAEVDGQEGLNYLWTEQEITDALGPADAETFNRIYGLDAGPNFADPHHGSGVPDKNILFLANTADVASSPLLDPHLRQLRQKLYDVRRQRKQPLLDTKVLTSWNALMIRALAVAGRILGESRYVQAAEKAADFLLTQHRTPDGGLYRTSRDGTKKYAGFLDDYAYLAWALTDLAAATGNERWRREASELMAAVQVRFGDTTGAGGYFFTDRSADDLIVRQKTASDSPLPSGNAAAAMALLALGDVPTATATIAAFVPTFLEQGEAMSSMLQAAMLRVQQGGAFSVEPVTQTNARTATAESLADGARSAVQITARRASVSRIVVRLQIADGWHINAHDPGAAGLVGTSITIDPADLKPHIAYPAGELLTAAFATEPVRVYSGTVEVPLTVAAEIPANWLIQLTVRYQPCDESSCLPPTQQTVAVE